MADMKCRVCGKHYDFCYNCLVNFSPIMFVWRQVTCSPQCFAIYMQQIEDFENENKANKPLE